MNKERLQEVIKRYQTIYETILNLIWPTMRDNGFAEHNQTVNFINAYCDIAKENNEVVSTWYEFQIPFKDKNNNRIDGMIINHTTNEIFFIEAKRISKNKLKKKIEELADDFCRIMGLDVITRFEENHLFIGSESIPDYKVYGVLLFDLWTETDPLKSFCSEWKNFCEEPDWYKLQELLGIKINLDSFNGLSRAILPVMKEIRAGHWKDENYCYNLAAFIWDTGLSEKEILL